MKTSKDPLSRARETFTDCIITSALPGDVQDGLLREFDAHLSEAEADIKKDGTLTETLYAIRAAMLRPHHQGQRIGAMARLAVDRAFDRVFTIIGVSPNGPG